MVSRAIPPSSVASPACSAHVHVHARVHVHVHGHGHAHVHGHGHVHVHGHGHVHAMCVYVESERSEAALGRVARGGGALVRDGRGAGLQRRVVVVAGAALPQLLLAVVDHLVRSRRRVTG